MVQYAGTRTADGCSVIRTEDARKEPLSPRLDLWDHSPTGFEWGYGGSGPAQLALALLADALGDDEQAVRLHQAFKWEVVGRLPKDGWQLRAEDVVETARALKRDQMQEGEAEETPS